MRRLLKPGLLFIFIAVALGATVTSQSNSEKMELKVLDRIISYDDSGDSLKVSEEDTLSRYSGVNRYDGLTDEDFRIVAKELGVEVAAIKAVVLIEAGSKMKGFWAPGVPVVNFDPTMYAKFKSKGTRGGDKNAKVPAGLSGYALKEWTQLTKARHTTVDGADMGTFWGMFQIGGFNYKRCGCSSVEEFVQRMSDSDFEQLELFAIFISQSGMVNDLKNKNWAAFSRRYNGPSYAKRGYHTRMAAAYRKFSQK